MAHRFEDTLEKDGLLHQPNDIILADNRVKMVAMEQYTLYEFHSFQVQPTLARDINLFKNIPSSSFSKIDAILHLEINLERRDDSFVAFFILE